MVAELITGALTYAFLCNLYIFLFTATLSSVSSNLLFRLSREALTPDDVERLYSGRAMAEVRIKRLVDAGFLAAGTTGLTLTAAGRRALRPMGACAASSGTSTISDAPRISPQSDWALEGADLASRGRSLEWTVPVRLPTKKRTLRLALRQIRLR